MHPQTSQGVGLAVPGQQVQQPEYERVAASFLISYRNANTRNNYARSLKVWFDWCLGRGVDPLHDVQRQDIEFWIRHLEDIQGKAARTIVHHLNALSGYYRQAEMDGHRDKDPMRFVKRPKIQRKSTTNFLTGPELGRMIEMASKRRVRDEAILCLLGYNGLRVSELVGLNVEHIGNDKGFTTITITRKGGDVQMLPLSHRATYAVNRLCEGRTHGPLFMSLRRPERLSRNDVGRLVKDYAKRTGVTKRVSPHSLRHSFVTLSLDAGVPQREVQRSAGHADARMTAYYDHGSSGLAKDATFGIAAHVEGMI